MSVTLNSDRNTLITEYKRVRRYTENLCQPLAVDDYQLQSIAQTSPPKWHIAHVSWLFEAFVLPQFQNDYRPYNPDFDFLFNSYYYTHGEMHPRPKRGLLSRPTVSEVMDYRTHVDRQMQGLMENVNDDRWRDLAFYVILGLNHEEQHQELMLMDIKHNFSVNPLKPAYRDDLISPRGETRPMGWLERSGGINQCGYGGRDFAYDNETPRHDILLRDHRLADRFITNGEYLEFLEDGGYRNPALWLADGWAKLHSEGWRHPLYWWERDGAWQQFTLGGMRELNPHEPVCHLSFFEADAYARWTGKRLPLEGEIETLLDELPIVGNFADSELYHPAPAGDKGQWFGDLWAWTASPYEKK